MIAKKISNLLLAAAVFAVGCAEKSAPPQTADSLYESIEFEMPVIQEPVISDYSVTLTDFGAVPGGIEMNTDAFAAAIKAVTEEGGGKVIIPSGIWLTGPIELKSNLELYAEQGAVIIFSADKNLYPVIATNFEGLDTYRCLSPIYGKNVENVAFTGKGVWDGNGDAWRAVKQSKLTESAWKELVKSGGVVNAEGDIWYPTEQYKNGAEGSGDQNVRDDLKTLEEFKTIRDYLRPVFVSIQSSKRIMFDGPVFQNSPAWNIHPLRIEHLTVKNLTVRNPWYSQNGDGIDIESCKNVLVQNCNFDVGDDAICIKSGKNEDGRRYGIPCENLIIKDNIVYHGHGGVTVGSEMSGGVRNMHVSNCTFIGTDVGLRFKSTRGRGGVVENIFISDVYMTNIPTNAISFNLYYGGLSISEMMEEGGMETTTELLPVTEETPQFKNIKISNVTVKGAKQAVFLQGLPEMPLENIELNDLRLKAENGFQIIDAKGVKINNVKLQTDEDEAIQILNVTDLEINGIDYDYKTADAIKINGSQSKNISISNPKTDLKQYTTVGSEVPAEAVKF
ncbi:glycoside hydrolase family 28 protein [Draconibacterium sp. IB214405]|uniref:glycoside hydrolase family 28 protein n=1 Tax=Draconibacterium sp. IB214405 TaxID=3097352 RepID=UPI002A1408B8|nr:glycoside hydrolase family 28 protein [Draconibacterium sp. IB214405]MDX8338924.1 glycoside hydrolase family 28 protein [Draconibacterium sp. IB214405]